MGTLFCKLGLQGTKKSGFCKLLAQQGGEMEFVSVCPPFGSTVCSSWWGKKVRPRHLYGLLFQPSEHPSCPRQIILRACSTETNTQAHSVPSLVALSGGQQLQFGPFVHLLHFALSVQVGIGIRIKIRVLTLETLALTLILTLALTPAPFFVILYLKNSNAVTHT